MGTERDKVCIYSLINSININWYLLYFRHSSRFWNKKVGKSVSLPRKLSFFWDWAQKESLFRRCHLLWGFPYVSKVKNPPAMQEMQEAWVWSLGQEDAPKKGMATYSNILAWRWLWTDVPGGLQSMESQRVRHNWSDLAHTHTTCYCLFVLLNLPESAASIEENWTEAEKHTLTCQSCILGFSQTLH